MILKSKRLIRKTFVMYGMVALLLEAAWSCEKHFSSSGKGDFMIVPQGF